MKPGPGPSSQFVFLIRVEIFQRTLKEGALHEVESLRKELADAKNELKGLKSDNLVLARTRTIKRILDHLKIQGKVKII